MCMPLRHPDYPCTGAMSEDLAFARDLARKRIRYGDPDEFTAPPVFITAAGTVSVNHGSPIVKGTGTNWNSDLVGAVLQVRADSTAYIILMIIDANKLVLSRSYVGSSATDKAYAIQQDNFGQLHDYLTHLVRGGPAAGPMVNHSIPLPIHNAGTITVDSRFNTVTGDSTGWNEDIAGLALQVIEQTTGTVAVISGSPVVIGNLTNWTDDLAGLTFQVSGETTEYVISQVDSENQQLRLDRDYVGPTGGGKPYTIVEQTPYTIVSVESSDHLTLDRAYARTTAELGTKKAYVILARLQPPDPGQAAALMPRQQPLDLILWATLQPAVAQMAGLYWIDENADPNAAFDYLLLADYDGRFVGLDPRETLELLREIGFSDVDGYIVFDKLLAPALPLTAPDSLRVYALPGSTRSTRAGDLSDASNNAGLRWNLGVTERERLLPGKPIMYHLWRADLGQEKPEDPPSANHYQLITENRAYPAHPAPFACW